MGKTLGFEGGFPSAKRRFCTETLKIKPIHEHVYAPIWDRGDTLISWQGIRRDESAARLRAKRWERYRYRRTDGPTWNYRPLVDWNLDRVWAIHRRFGVPPNQLYRWGATRVGCFPCVMGSRTDYRLAAHFPEEVDRVREWERLVGMAGKQAVPAATLRPGKDVKVRGEITTETHGIDAAIFWATRSKGGRHVNTFEIGEMFGPCSEVGWCGD